MQHETSDLAAFQPGTIIRQLIGKTDGPYIVTANHGDYVTAVRTINIAIAEYWQIVAKAPSQER